MLLTWQWATASVSIRVTFRALQVGLLKRALIRSGSSLKDAGCEAGQDGCLSSLQCLGHFNGKFDCQPRITDQFVGQF